MFPLLDSNIIIYAGGGTYPFLRPWVSDIECRVSTISIPEVLGYPGLSTEDEQLFEAWFAAIVLVEADRAIMHRAALLRRQRRMTLGDAIVAATALEHRLKLVTRNVDDFRHIADLNLVNPFAETEA